MYSLCKSRIDSEIETINKIYYFSSLSLNIKKDAYNSLPDKKIYNTKDLIDRKIQKSKRSRHTAYRKCLKSTDISIILGQHVLKGFTECRECKNGYPNIEEKCTDVNLALQVFIEFHKNTCDKAIIVSADNDFGDIPKQLKDCFPNKELAYIFPYQSRNMIIGRKLRNLGNNYKVLSAFTLAEYAEHQFPNEVIAKDGTKIIRPTEYK